MSSEKAEKLYFLIDEIASDYPSSCNGLPSYGPEKRAILKAIEDFEVDTMVDAIQEKSEPEKETAYHVSNSSVIYTKKGAHYSARSNVGGGFTCIPSSLVEFPGSSDWVLIKPQPKKYTEDEIGAFAAYFHTIKLSSIGSGLTIDTILAQWKKNKVKPCPY